jgi:hypothetical protein
MSRHVARDECLARIEFGRSDKHPKVLDVCQLHLALCEVSRERELSIALFGKAPRPKQNWCENYSQS